MGAPEIELVAVACISLTCSSTVLKKAVLSGTKRPQFGEFSRIAFDHFRGFVQKLLCSPKLNGAPA